MMLSGTSELSLGDGVAIVYGGRPEAEKYASHTVQSPHFNEGSDYPAPPHDFSLDTGSREQTWKIEEQQFPCQENVQTLVSLLRPKELREITAGIITDLISCCRDRDLLRASEDLNGWIATGEEYVEFRRNRRHILQARQRMVKNT